MAHDIVARKVGGPVEFDRDSLWQDSEWRIYKLCEWCNEWDAICLNGSDGGLLDRRNKETAEDAVEGLRLYANKARITIEPLGD